MYSKILVPLAADHAAVGARAMQSARALLAEGGTITVLTVLEQVPSYVAQYLPRDQDEKNRAEIDAGLAQEFADTPEVQHEVRSGHPAQTILEVAERGGYDCVVIASHRPGLQDYLLGSTAARVVRHAQCSVHVLR
jgi:nucleotide-binding universal stress UspA family protein